MGEKMGTRMIVNAGGREFHTTLDTLSANSSYFASLSSSWAASPRSATRTCRVVFLDADPDAFERILSYMRSGNTTLPMDEELGARIVLLARLLGVDGLLNALKKTVKREQELIPGLEQRLKSLQATFKQSVDAQDYVEHKLGLKSLAGEPLPDDEMPAQLVGLSAANKRWLSAARQATADAKAAQASAHHKLGALKKQHERHSPSQRALHAQLVKLLESLELDGAEETYEDDDSFAQEEPPSGSGSASLPPQLKALLTEALLTEDM